MPTTTLLPESHASYLTRASLLSSYQVMNPIAPADVIKVLNRKKVKFVLVGAYGLVGWLKEPRATEDVDIIVAARHQKKAVNALLEAFANLEADDQEVVIRLRDRMSRRVDIDVMKTNQPLMQAVFKNTKTVRLGRQEYSVPSLEMGLALKFAPMISLVRADEKKHLDAHDFILMVKANTDIDLARLAELGEMVYPGGGKEIVEKVRQVRAGERLQL